MSAGRSDPKKLSEAKLLRRRPKKAQRQPQAGLRCPRRLHPSPSHTARLTAPDGQTPPDVANSHEDTRFEDPVMTKQKVAYEEELEIDGKPPSETV